MCDADLMASCTCLSGPRGLPCPMHEVGSFRPPDPTEPQERPLRLVALHVEETRYVMPLAPHDFYPERRPFPRAARYKLTLTMEDGTKHEFDTFGSADFLYTFASEDETA